VLFSICYNTIKKYKLCFIIYITISLFK